MELAENFISHIVQSVLAQPPRRLGNYLDAT